MITTESIYDLLAEIPDPEIPVITISELGILRSVEVNGDELVVRITPTYNGCPAMMMIEKQIKKTLFDNGIENVSVKTVYEPAWTTDWLSEVAKEKLRKYGIATPGKSGRAFSLSGDKKVECPRCGSEDARLVSQFGSTACKAIYTCNSCKEPYDLFKCH